MKLVPEEGIGPPTYALQVRCSTVEPFRHNYMVAYGGIEPTVFALKGQRTSPLFE